jgi:methionine sulfoxide reductase heme-binding subunit
MRAHNQGQPGPQRRPNRRGRPLGTSRDWHRRLLLHHLPLALASAVVLVLFVGLSPFTTGRHAVLDTSSGRALPTAQKPSSQPMQMGHGQSQPAGRTLGFQLPRRISRGQLSVATGYLALGLLGVTLLIGPANLLLRRRNPVSNSLRRDVGTWTAIASVAHVILALQPHGDRGMFGFLDYFVAAGRPLTNSFGLGNWTGLAALVIVAGLLAISTDRALRELKATRWKRLQRLNYALFALVVLHTFFYGALLRMTSPFTLLLFCIVVAVFAGQAVGIWLWRRRIARTADSQSDRQPADLAG